MVSHSEAKTTTPKKKKCQKRPYAWNEAVMLCFYFLRFRWLDFDSSISGADVGVIQEPVRRLVSQTNGITQTCDSWEAKKASRRRLVTYSVGASFFWALHHNDAQQFLLSSKSVNWPRQHGRGSTIFDDLFSFSECLICNFGQPTSIFCKRRFERATGRCHNHRQPCGSAGDAPRHVHSPVVQASALLPGGDRSRSRFRCRASVCRESLPSGIFSRPRAMCAWLVIVFHRGDVQRSFALDFGSDQPGPIRRFVLPPQVSPDCDDPASLCSARLHLGSCPALGSRVAPEPWTVACSNRRWRWPDPVRNFRSVRENILPFASSEHWAPSSRPSAATGGKHTEHGEVQKNSVRHDVGLRACPGLLPPFLFYDCIQISCWKDTS